MRIDPYCDNCGQQNILYVGAETIEAPIPTYKQRLSQKYKEFRSRIEEKWGNARKNITERIDKLLVQLETEETSPRGFRSLSPNGKQRVIHALENARTTLGSSENEEEIASVQEYLDTLPERLQEENCIVCMRPLKYSTENIVLCPHCERGGHRSHLMTWLERSTICPLCRSSIDKNDLKEFKLHEID